MNKMLDLDCEAEPRYHVLPVEPCRTHFSGRIGIMYWWLVALVDCWSAASRTLPSVFQSEIYLAVFPRKFVDLFVCGIG